MYYLHGITLNNENKKVHPTIECHYLSSATPGDRQISQGTWPQIQPDPPGLYTIELGYVYTPPTRFDSIGLFGIIDVRGESFRSWEERFAKEERSPREIQLDSNDTSVLLDIDVPRFFNPKD
jgi:hypothetical protein